MKVPHSIIGNTQTDKDMADLRISTNDKAPILYNRIQEGLNDIKLGNARPFAEAIATVKVKHSK